MYLVPNKNPDFQTPPFMQIDPPSFVHSVSSLFKVQPWVFARFV